MANNIWAWGSMHKTYDPVNSLTLLLHLNKNDPSVVSNGVNTRYDWKMGNWETHDGYMSTKIKGSAAWTFLLLMFLFFYARNPSLSLKIPFLHAGEEDTENPGERHLGMTYYLCSVCSWNPVVPKRTGESPTLSESGGSTLFNILLMVLRFLCISH